MDSKPATPLSEQSDKTKKYDRQLRLWGDHGQALLETAHVCICGVSAAAVAKESDLSPGASSVLGVEVLRSLVLPGVGKITILDDARVTEADLGNNLFVSTVGALRGEETLQSLLEMNPDVRGSFIDQSVDGILQSQPDFFNNFTIVVAVNMPDKPLLQLSQILWKVEVPLVIVKSYGLLGYMRIQNAEQTIIESHPDNSLIDLRLLDPFPSLKEHLESIDLESLSDTEHSHVPYVGVIYYYLQKWIKERGAPPSNYKEKKELGQQIREGMRLKNPSDFEENFEEAIKALNTCLRNEPIPSSLKQLFELIPRPLTPTTQPFWLVLQGLETFVSEQQRAPISGVVPDMTADSASYITLQNIYREQANLDCEAVLRHTLECPQLSGNCESRRGVTESLVRLVCKNSANLRVLRGSSLEQEYSNKVDLVGCGAELDDSAVVWYILLRAVELFYSEFRCYPGYEDHQVETDIVRLKVHVNRLLNEWGSNINVTNDHIHEVCRYGAAQIHSVASFVGGCAAHEIIKLITLQYVPIDNTFIYDAGRGTTLTLKL